MAELTTEEKQKIYEEEKARLEAQGEIKKNKQAQDGATGCAAGCLIIIILIAIYFFNSSGGKTTNSTEKAPRVDKKTAYAAARVFVKSQLKSPSTASFPITSEADISELDENLWRVESYVDAENSFGAMIRTNYIAIVRYEAEDDNWIAENIELIE